MSCPKALEGLPCENNLSGTKYVRVGGENIRLSVALWAKEPDASAKRNNNDETDEERPSVEA